MTLNNGNNNLCLIAGSELLVNSWPLYESRAFLLGDCATTEDKYKKWIAIDRANYESLKGKGCKGAATTDYSLASCPVVTTPESNGSNFILKKELILLVTIISASVLSLF